MECSTKKFIYRNLPLRFCVILMLFSFLVVSVSAVDANGNEFFSPLDYGTIIDSSDSSNIIYRTSTPTDWILTNVRNDIDPDHEWSYPIGDYMGQSVDFWYSGTSINMLMKPWTGDNIGAGVSGTHVLNGHIVDLTYFPDNTVFSGGFDVTIFSGGDVGYKAECWFILHFVDSEGLVVHSYYRRIEPEIVTYTQNTVTYRYDPSINLGNLDLPDTVAGMIPVYTVKHLSVNDNYQIIVDYSAPCFEFEMDALEMEAHNNSQLQYTIKAVQELQKQMDDISRVEQEQNEKLDDIISGGSAGEDLMAGSDKLEDAGSDLGDDLGSIQDFEDQYMGQLDDNMDEVIAGADLTWIYPALSFVQRYLNKIVAAIPSKYLIVFTLPMFFGLFMYIVGHPVRAPRPDTSGDEVTRETFTETHILTGKNAGTVRSTRTVTTSREIGRVHNE